jgi:hypothetical protein
MCVKYYVHMIDASEFVRANIPFATAYRYTTNNVYIFIIFTRKTNRVLVFMLV